MDDSLHRQLSTDLLGLNGNARSRSQHSLYIRLVSVIIVPRRPKVIEDWMSIHIGASNIGIMLRLQRDSSKSRSFVLCSPWNRDKNSMIYCRQKSNPAAARRCRPSRGRRSSGDEVTALDSWSVWLYQLLVVQHRDQREGLLSCACTDGQAAFFVNCQLNQ